MPGPPSGPRLTRRAASLLTAALLTRSPAGLRAAEDVPDAGVDGRLPVVFVHGDGDSKAVWTTTVWRFESSGYSRERLFAVELESPTATHAYDVPEDGRSTAGQAEAQLARFVQEVLRRTRAGKVVLVGNSRGANTIRDYLENGGGA